MNREEFLSEWGSEWRKFAGKPMFAALLSCIDDNGPSRAMVNRSDADTLHGGSVLAAGIRGHEALRLFLTTLGTEPERAFEPQDKFNAPETI